MNDKTGGPAFPLQDASAWQFHGMTLRDYFASAAMQAYLSNGERDSFPYDSWAEAAYHAADEMLEAREK